MMFKFAKRGVCKRLLLLQHNVIPSDNRIKLRCQGYVTEAAEIAQGILEGTLEGVDPDECTRCDVCKKVYYEVMENRSVDELPPACALQSMWVKKWLMNHDSFYMYDPKSLDSSNDKDDESLEKHARESIVIPENPQEKAKTKCGLHCCQD